MFKSLQSLRGVFAILIFLFHCSGNLQCIPECFGRFGVSFFFMLSGFVLSIGYHKKIIDGSLSYKSFFLRRFLRVYPLHLFCFLLWAVMLGDASQIISLKSVCSIMLIQSWVPDLYYIFYSNAVAWYLSSWLFCILLFPFVAKMIDYSLKKKVNCALTTGLLVLYIISIILVPEDMAGVFVYVNPVFRIVDFIIGAWLWQFFNTEYCNRYLSKLTKNSFLASITQFSIIIVFILLIWISQFDLFNAKIELASLWWLPNGLIILIFAYLDDCNTIINKVLNLKFVKSFSEISFTYFMTHLLSIWIWMKYLGIPGIIGVLEFSIVAVFLFSVCVAAIVHRVVEVPVSKLLYRLINSDRVLIGKFTR